LVGIEGLSVSTLGELLLFGVKLCLKATVTNITTTFSLESEMSCMHFLGGYRRSKKIMICFIITNDNRQRRINLSILLGLMLARTYSELMHRDGLMHIFSLIVIVM
jgi:hypothetical protein